MTIPELVKKLLTLNLFKSVNENMLSSFLNLGNWKVTQCKKNTTVLMQNDVYGSLYILLEGECNAEMLSSSGKVIKIEDLKAPYPIALAILFSSDNVLPVNVITKTDVVILILSKDFIYSMCRVDENFMKNIFTEISDKFRFISERFAYQTFRTIRSKIANFFLSHSRLNLVELPVSIEELAKYFGVSRPSLSREIGNMIQENLLKQQGKNYIIINKNKLINLADEV